MHILLIEDNPGDVRLTQEVLKEGQRLHELHAVPDGEEALRYLEQTGPHQRGPRPDIIFLDLNLPKVGGLEVLRRIRQMPAWQHIPVLILTTSEAERDIQEAYRLRANGYITKPVDINQFVEVIISIERFWFEVATLAP